MKTWKDIYEYCKRNNTGVGTSEKWSIRHCELAVSNLMSNEEAVFAMIGMVTMPGDKHHRNNHVVMLTDRRLLIAQKTALGQSVQDVPVSQIDNVRYTAGLVFGTIEIKTVRETIKVEMAAPHAKQAANLLQECLSPREHATVGAPQQSEKGAKYLDNLLYIGAQLDDLFNKGKITQEEYDKRRQDLFADLWKEED